MPDPDNRHGRMAINAAQRRAEPIEMVSNQEWLAYEVDVTAEIAWTAPDREGPLFVDWSEDLGRIDP